MYLRNLGELKFQNFLSDSNKSGIMLPGNCYKK